MQDPLTKFAFPILRDIYDFIGDDAATLDPGAVIEKVRRVHAGMSSEHEFAALATWLGKCSLVTQLDNVLHSRREFRAPDFLVVANYNGRPVPFLVEVKSQLDSTLTWSAKYHASLRGFAELVNLPLLVAWRCRGLWALADSALFEKKVRAFHLSFQTAMQNNLMSMLLGNFWLHLAPEFRFELKMRILTDFEHAQPLLPEGSYRVQIEDAGLWVAQRRLTGKEEKHLLWFLAAGQSEENSNRDADILTKQYLVGPDRVINLSDILVAQIACTKGEAEPFDWLVQVRKGLRGCIDDIEGTLSRAVSVGAVKLVLQQRPKGLPAFLL